MDLTNEFFELSQDDLMMTEGGSVFSKIVDGVEGFFTNTLVWTTASYMIKNFYQPIKV